MAVLSDYTSGTISLAQGSVTVTGTGTLFEVLQFREGDTLQIQNLTAIIKSVDSNTQLTLAEPWTGTTLTNAPYRARSMADNERVSGLSRNVIVLLGNGILSSIAEIPVQAGKLLIGNSAGGYDLIDKLELGGGGGGSSWDATTPTLAGLAGFESQANGYKVLVEDNGTGRAAVYIKLSTGWSSPIYFTGPAGPLPEITIDDTVTLAPGQPATVTKTPTPDGFELQFSIPSGKGYNPAGEYAGATTYQLGDVVTYNGSSYVAKVVTQGVLPTNTTNWNLVALKGADGTGTGDVSGPSSSVANRIAIFNGTTGKLIIDGSVTIDQIRTNTANVGAAVAGANGQTTINDADTATGVLSGTGTLVRWTWGNIKAWIKGWIVPADVGLGNVNNTADANKPVSTAQAAAIALKVAIAGNSGIGAYSSVLHDLGNSSGRSITPDLTVSNYQQLGNNGAFTINAPAIGNYTIIISVWSNTGAGAMTALGFNKVNGTFTPAKTNFLIITCVSNIRTLDIKEAN